MPQPQEPTTPPDPRGRPVVLGFFAHPDDETLSAGGVLALLSRSADVHVLTATRGEMGEVVAPEGRRTEVDRTQLPVTRAREVKLACAELGALSHDFLDGGDGRYRDSGMAWEDERRIRAVPDPNAPAGAFSTVDLEQVAQDLAARIVELRPTLMLTEEPAGGYGHPDHIRCHDATMRAVEIAAPEWEVPLVAFAVQNADMVRAANAELVGNPDLPLVDDYGIALNRPDLEAPLRTGVSEDVDIVLDTTPVLEEVTAAISAHRTQVHTVSRAEGDHLAGWYALTNNDLKPILTHAALQLAPGWGTREELVGLFVDMGIRQSNGGSQGPSELYNRLLNGFGLLTGVIVAFGGTFTHRANPPWGLAIALLGVLAGAVMYRTLGAARTVFAYAAGVIVTILVITSVRPGGDVVVVQDARGLAWLVGAMILPFIGSLMGGRASRPPAPAKRVITGDR